MIADWDAMRVNNFDGNYRFLVLFSVNSSMVITFSWSL